MAALKTRAIQPRDIIPIIQSMLPILNGHASRAQPVKDERQLTVGICVSGGPDSMALAYLMNSLPILENLRLVPFAMIVDHHVRPNSTAEATQVQAELARKGIAATVLNMAWAQGEDPLKWPNFESEARIRRYRLIAATALRHRINHIFTGHHLDDQVETIMMRLAFQRHRNLFGLQGIAPSSPIPCCDDILGAHEDLDANANIAGRRPVSATRRTINAPDNTILAKRSIPHFSAGGLMLHRPLLRFPKLSLIATCQENDVSFVVDETNSDATITRRNAVRALRSCFQVPKSLSSQRIQSLQTRATQQFQRCTACGDQYLGQFIVKKLDLASGRLVVQLPDLQVFDSDQRRGLSNALARLSSIVTPSRRDDMPLQVPDVVLSTLFPPSVAISMGKGSSLEDEDEDDQKLNFRRVSFTRSHLAKRTWILERQPMRTAEEHYNSWQFMADQEQSALHTEIASHSSAWKLWDNRFWIRLLGTTHSDIEDVSIRPLTKTSLQDLRKSLTMHKNKRTRGLLSSIEKALNASAPASTRFTLPTLVTKGKVIALPTLGFRFAYLTCPEKKEVEYEVAYKSNADLGKLRFALHGPIARLHPGHYSSLEEDLSFSLQRYEDNLDQR